MKQLTAAPQKPAVAFARARGAFGLMIAGTAFGDCGSTNATNLSTRRLGMRPT